LIGIFACFCGVLMMANPPTEDIGSEFGNSNPDFESVWYTLGLLAIVITAGTDGLSAVFARSMKDIHFSKMLYWFSLVGFIGTLGIVMCESLYNAEVPTILTYDSNQMMSLLLSGLFAGFNTTCLTIAFQNERSTTVSLLAYIELVYSFLADVFLFNATFSTMELTGAAVITFFNLLTIV
jgi:drug/metabolite transporter (DMT)-like permease